MNRNRSYVTCSFLLITVLVSIPLVLGQNEWDWCVVSAYGKLEAQGFYPTATITFTVAESPIGTLATNTMSVSKDSTGENYTIDLNPGNRVILTWLDTQPEVYTLQEDVEEDYYFIAYEGYAWQATVDGNEIPEFSPILIAPMFIAITLLALIYRRKHKNID